MILQVIENLKIAHCTLCMCYTHCTFVMCNPKHCISTQLLWVLLGSCAPPTVAEAKPWRQRRYCFTWNNYPLDAEEQLRSLAERKRIVVPRSSIRRCCSPTAAICHSTASIRHIILFSKVELALRTSTKNSKMILQVIENLKI